MNKVQVEWKNKFANADKLEKDTLASINKIIERTKIQYIQKIKSKVSKKNYKNGVYTINPKDIESVSKNAFDQLNILAYDLYQETNKLAYKQALGELNDLLDKKPKDKSKSIDTLGMMNQFSKGLGYSFYDYSNQMMLYFGFTMMNDYMSIINRNIDSDLAGKNLSRAIGNALSKGSSELNRDIIKQKKMITSLIDNEMIYNYEQTQLQAYKDNNIVKVVWVTEKDDKVCDDCQSKEGKVFDIDKIDPLPEHPNCRCYYEAYVEK
jgi:SPP1 gp7 family putative phage head morphogenesis protein